MKISKLAEEIVTALLTNNFNERAAGVTLRSPEDVFPENYGGRNEQNVKDTVQGALDNYIGDSNSVTLSLSDALDMAEADLTDDEKLIASLSPEQRKAVMAYARGVKNRGKSE